MEMEGTILLGELEALGFSKAQATKAISAGNSNIEDAINWIVDHENDTETNNEPLVPINIDVEASLPLQFSEQVKLRAQALRNQGREKKAEQEKKLEREREKKRIQAGKELLKAKRTLEESERERFLAQWKAEKEEERRARERIRQKLHQDKLHRKGMPGLSSDGNVPVKSATSLSQKIENLSSHSLKLLPAKPMTKKERITECLRSLKRQNKENQAYTTRALQTLFIYVKNVVGNPKEEKFRKIRITNPAFQERVGRFEEGMEFLELCGFERVDGGKYLYLPREKVDTNLLKLAGAELQKALSNPFFGLLSR